MKKLITLLLALVMAMFMVACSDDTTMNVDYDEDEMAEDETTDETSTDDSGMTISDFIDENYEDMINQQGDLEAEGMSLNITDGDGVLMYQFKFLEQVTDVAATKILIDETLAANAEIYSSISEALAVFVPSAVGLTVEYYNADDKLITYGIFDTTGGVELLGDMTISDFITVNEAAFTIPADDPQAEFLTLEAHEVDNSLVVVYTFINEISDIDTTVEELENPSAEITGYFQSLYESLVYMVPDATSIIVEYYGSDGSFITAVEYQ